jgi:regulator of protease activity HflC (stomatin/prohibitin superfamily)
MSFVQFIIDTLQLLWPLSIVKEWENGALYRFGRFVRLLGPGVYATWPWFEEIQTRGVVKGIVRGSRQDITLKDGSVVTFELAARVRVRDLGLALNAIDQYEESLQEVMETIGADTMREMDPSRARPERLGRLLGSVKGRMQTEADEFGLEIDSVSFRSFVHNARVFRLLGEQTTFNTW